MHELYRDPEVHAAVVDHWGEEMAPGGVVDRAAVARRAFATAEDREWLESLIWPKVGERIAEWRAIESTPRARRRRRWSSRCRCCSRRGWTPRSTRRSRSSPTTTCGPQRAAARGHEAVDERTARQLGQQEKAQRATYAVQNSGSLDELENKLSSVLEKLST